MPTAALRFRPRAADGTPDVGAVPRSGSGDTRPDTAPSARVFVLRDGQPSPVAIETGLADESYTEVKSGAVTVGDPIVIAAERSAKDAEPPRAQPPGFSSGQRRGR